MAAPLALTVAASVLVLILASDRVEAKSESQRDGRIAFIVGESGDIGPTPRLMLMGADGSNPHLRLGWVYHASFSPNGRFLAYDPRTMPRSIREVAADGGRKDRLLVRNGRDVDWSPAGGSVAFVRGPFFRGSEIWVRDLRSRRQRRIARNGEFPSWSWDGKKIAFVRGSDIWVVELASRKPWRLIRNAANPRFSPDGTHIAFEREVAPDVYIYIARADGRAPHRVAEGESPAWSPKGREIAFTDGRRIIRMRSDGSHRRRIYASKEYCACRDLDWAP
jgi:Tol biopolymer transport system component